MTTRVAAAAVGAQRHTILEQLQRQGTQPAACPAGQSAWRCKQIVAAAAVGVQRREMLEQLKRQGTQPAAYPTDQSVWKDNKSCSSSISSSWCAAAYDTSAA
jgi:predicted short-subunit dehydrogenase-like oxidoreductase (DUF2520 family)